MSVKLSQAQMQAVVDCAKDWPKTLTSVALLRRLDALAKSLQANDALAKAVQPPSEPPPAKTCASCKYFRPNECVNPRMEAFATEYFCPTADFGCTLHEAT